MGRLPGSPRKAPRDETFTIVPPPAAIMCWTAHQVTFAAPIRLSPIVSGPGLLPRLVGDLGDRVGHMAVAGRVVHQHVEAAELRCGGVDHGADRDGVGDVGLDDDVAVAVQAGHTPAAARSAESRWWTATVSPALAKDSATARPMPLDEPVTSTLRLLIR